MGFAPAPIQNVHKIADIEQTREEGLQQRQTETERYLLQIDRQTKRSFKTPEAGRSMGLEIKGRFPAFQVSIYDTSPSRAPWSRYQVRLGGQVRLGFF